MTETAGDDLVCDLCGEHPIREGRAFVDLNRYVIGDANGVSMMEAVIEDENGEEYSWDPENHACSGTLLCFPICMTQWMEAKLVECAVVMREKPCDEQ